MSDEGRSSGDEVTTLKIYNTMTRKKEVFKPLTPGVVRIYTCGMTVYDYPHLGHARTYSNWDIVVRYLRYKGYDVIHVQNFTDVGHLTSDSDWGEDKIVKRAREKKVHPMELVDHYIKEYFAAMDALKIQRANIMPRATGHIAEMIELIKKLEQKGYTYETKSGVYFDVSKFPTYGKMSRMKIDEQQQSRVEHDPEKRHAADFALWIKAGPEHIMRWPSPWGWGYPGWHIECSAMSMKYLGETLDIHGGGTDHIALHHPNERAQSEAATGKQFVRYWMHSAFMTINKEKMSKSTGRFITAREAIERYGPNVVRFFLITAHYRTVVDFSEDIIIQARENYFKLMNTMESVRLYLQTQTIPQSDPTPSEYARTLQKNFEAAMNDDFNTPKALSVLYEYSNYLNKQLVLPPTKNQIHLKADYELFLKLANVLAIDPQPFDDVRKILEILVDLRAKARKEKNYELADKIRDQLKTMKVRIEDKPWGTIFIREHC